LITVGTITALKKGEHLVVSYGIQALHIGIYARGQ
jgi:hypothetical protein